MCVLPKHTHNSPQIHNAQVRHFNSNSTQIALDFCGIFFRFLFYFILKKYNLFFYHSENVCLKLFSLYFSFANIQHILNPWHLQNPHFVMHSFIGLLIMSLRLNWTLLSERFYFYSNNCDEELFFFIYLCLKALKALWHCQRNNQLISIFLHLKLAGLIHEWC